VQSSLAPRIVEEREKAREEARRQKGGLVLFTDGSRLESGATGYGVVWKDGEQWAGVKTHMGYNQEAFDAECAALARALEVAAMARIGSDEPGPAQQYALEARKWAAKLKERNQNVRVEIRWCPAHEGVEGNEKADEGARQAAEEPDAPGVEWMGYRDRYGKRQMPLPRSLANISREITAKKWEEAWRWSRSRVKAKKYRMPNTMHQNKMVARGSKRLAGRFHQLKTGHCLTGQYLKWTRNSKTAECGWCRYQTQTREHLFKNCNRWKMQQKILWAEVRKETGRGKNRFTIRDLFADERCIRPILDFLRTTRVGARVGPKRPPPEGERVEGPAEAEEVPAGE